MYSTYPPDLLDLKLRVNHWRSTHRFIREARNLHLFRWAKCEYQRWANLGLIRTFDETGAHLETQRELLISYYYCAPSMTKLKIFD